MYTKKKKKNRFRRGLLALQLGLFHCPPEKEPPHGFRGRGLDIPEHAFIAGQKMEAPGLQKNTNGRPG